MHERYEVSQTKKLILTSLMLTSVLAGCKTEKSSPTAPTPKTTAAFSAESQVRALDSERIKLMQGVTLRDIPGCATPEQLRVIDVPYHDFTGTNKMGSLVVRDTLASEVGDIFEDIYKTGFQIDHITLPEEVTTQRSQDPNMGETIDDELMDKNTTSAFNCRLLDGKPDKHGQGRAIDINPLENPMITPNPFVTKNAKYYDYSPPAAKGTWEASPPERLLSTKSRIGQKVIDIFKKRGWRWGGDFKSLYDGQHFDKP
jgi:hypothetical protein